MEPKSQSKSKRAIGQSKLWLKQKDWTFTSCWTRMKATGNEKQTKPVEYIFASKRKGERFVQILRDLFRTKLLDNQTESSQVIIGGSSLKEPKKQKKTKWQKNTKFKFFVGLSSSPLQEKKRIFPVLLSFPGMLWNFFSVNRINFEDEKVKKNE